MKKYICLLIVITVLFISKINAYTEYKIGDEVEYNGIDYYVIENSSSTDSTITLLKSEPITSVEIKDYLAATEVASKVDINDKYASIPYYSRDTCVSAGDTSGCTTDYKVSDVKQVVDVWAKNYTKLDDLEEVRLLSEDELFNNLGYDWKITSAGGGKHPDVNENVPSWLYNSAYSYWTMGVNSDSSQVFYISTSGTLLSTLTGRLNIRPVITLKKAALGDIDEIIDNKVDNSDIAEKDNIATKVDVPNTYLSKSLVIIIIGTLFACVSIVIYYIIKKKHSERK